MFDRCVKLPDGVVAYHHEAVKIEHRLYGSTYVYIESDGIVNALSCDLDTSMGFEDAERWAKSLPEYAEYEDSTQEVLDEVAALLTDEQAEHVPQAFREWQEDKAYSVGDRVRWQDLYKCLQAHTSQAGWEPDAAPSLWARIGEPGDIPEWEQPTGANPYMEGDKVRHVGKVWESLVDNNVWEPGAVGTESLWAEVQS